MLNASRSGAGVSNALPYYLLLIGSAFVELLRRAPIRFLDRTIDYYRYSRSSFVSRRIGQIKGRICSFAAAGVADFYGLS